MVTMLRTITLGRHGQSDQNVIKQGKVEITDTQLRLFRERDTGDHRLTKEGVEDGRKMGKILRELGTHFTLLVTSTFPRAMETLLETGFEGPVEVSPLFDERYTGELETLRNSEKKVRFPTAGDDRRRKETRWRPPNGESMRDSLVRTLIGMDHVFTLMGYEGDALIITHSRIIASYMWWAEQLEDDEVPGEADGGGGRKIVNGQVIQYGWAWESLRPTHRRSFVPGEPIDLEWKPLPKNSRFTLKDLRQMVEKYPRIL